MNTQAMSAQEIERTTVFQYADSFPLFPESGDVIAYVIDPSTGALITEATTMDTVIEQVMRHGRIAYAVGEIADENGEDTYWTTDRLQRLFDHHRRRYVTGE